MSYFLGFFQYISDMGATVMMPYHYLYYGLHFRWLVLVSLYVQA